jgi:hypothetical protein
MLRPQLLCFTMLATTLNWLSASSPRKLEKEEVLYVEYSSILCRFAHSYFANMYKE